MGFKRVAGKGVTDLNIQILTKLLILYLKGFSATTFEWAVRLKGYKSFIIAAIAVILVVSYLDWK
jgi:hypothetical protein